MEGKRERGRGGEGKRGRGGERGRGGGEMDGRKEYCRKTRKEGEKVGEFKTSSKCTTSNNFAD